MEVRPAPSLQLAQFGSRHDITTEWVLRPTSAIVLVRQMVSEQLAEESLWRTNVPRQLALAESNVSPPPSMTAPKRRDTLSSNKRYATHLTMGSTHAQPFLPNWQVR